MKDREAREISGRDADDANDANDAAIGRSRRGAMRPDTKIFLDAAAKAVSVIMHPFVVPVYAVLLLLYGNTVMAFFPSRVKFFMIFVVLLNTMVVPALAVGVLRATNYLHDFSLKTTRSRTVPLLIAAICYIVCAFLIDDFITAFLLRRFMLAGAACVVFALIVTYFWKISIHMTAVGGVLAMLVTVAVSGMGNMIWVLVVWILLSGLLASARLWLGAHTPMQVSAGFIGGFAVAGLAMIFV